MSVQLRREHGKNETNKKALQVSGMQGFSYVSFVSSYMVLLVFLNIATNNILIDCRRQD